MCSQTQKWEHETVYAQVVVVKQQRHLWWVAPTNTSRKWKLKFIELNSDGREEVRTQQGLGDPKGRGGDDKYTVRRPQEPQQEKKPLKLEFGEKFGWMDVLYMTWI